MLKALTAILLLPVCFSTGKSFFAVILAINTTLTSNSFWAYFLIGFVFYIIIHLFFFKPIRMYVFGHELTHAFAGIITGSKVKSFNTGKTSGSVTLTKVNMFITLSPYFVPIYSLILIFCYWLMTKFVVTNTGYFKVFLFLFGITVSFHLMLTLFAISQGQPDFQEYGIIVSILVIFITNCIVLSLVLILFFPVINLGQSAENLCSDYVYTISEIVKFIKTSYGPK
jgi:hypothetical protein